MNEWLDDPYLGVIVKRISVSRVLYDLVHIQVFIRGTL